MMSYIIGIIVCGLLIAADQFTKYLVVEKLKPLRSQPFIPGFMEFRYHTNEGAAFGLLQGGRWIFIAFAAVLLVAVVYFYITLPKKGRIYTFLRAAMVLITAGALGNAIDRARQGFVVDFMSFLFIDFAIFNVADMCIVCGTILAAILIIFFYKETPRNDAESK